MVGPQGLVKSSETSGNGNGGIVVGPRGQVQQCNAHDNADFGILALGDNCLITMNTANSNGGANGGAGIATALGNKCTVSYNTANSNGGVGIDVGEFGGTGHLVTQNVAMGNGAATPKPHDFEINCPSTVTNNTSSGTPNSFAFNGTGCHLVNNE